MNRSTNPSLLDRFPAPLLAFLALVSGTFDNVHHVAMNLIFYTVVGGIWGATEPIRQ